MVDKKVNQNYGCQLSCDCDSDCQSECNDDVEVVELEDENGEVEEFVILEEVDFEGRRFAIMAPLAEVQTCSNKELGSEDDFDVENLNIEIFEVKDDDFTVLDDDVFAERLLAHLDGISDSLEKKGE